MRGYQANKKRRADKAKAEEIADAVKAGKEEGKAKGNAKAEAEEAAYKTRLKQIDRQQQDEMLALQAMGLSYEEYTAKKKELEDKFNQERIKAIKDTLATETELTQEQIDELKSELISLQEGTYKKPDDTGSSAASSDENPQDESVSKAKQISEAINASALALNDFSDNPAWGNILKNVATLAANWDQLHEQIKAGGQQAFTAYAQIAATALSAVAQMMNGLAAEQDTTNNVVLNLTLNVVIS